MKEVANTHVFVKDLVRFIVFICNSEKFYREFF